MNLVKQKAGRLGGISTFKKYGVEHFRKIGLNGARVTHSRYRLTPTGLNDFAMIDRATGEVKAFLNKPLS